MVLGHLAALQNCGVAGGGAPGTQCARNRDGWVPRSVLTLRLVPIFFSVFFFSFFPICFLLLVPIFIYRKERNWGWSVPYGCKFCPHVIPAVVSDIIYTLLTLGLFDMKIRRDRNSSRAFKDLHNCDWSSVMMSQVLGAHHETNSFN